MFPQLFDGLLSNVVHTFMFPSEWNIKALMIPTEVSTEVLITTHQLKWCNFKFKYIAASQTLTLTVASFLYSEAALMPETGRTLWRSAAESNVVRKSDTESEQSASKSIKRIRVSQNRTQKNCVHTTAVNVVFNICDHLTAVLSPHAHIFKTRKQIWFKYEEMFSFL